MLGKNKIYHTVIKENYDVEIAFLEGAITRLFSSKNTDTKKIAWIHNEISSVFGKGMKAKIKRKMDARLYQKYETLVFVSKENLKDFQNTYPHINNQKEVIYNYLEEKSILEKAEKVQQNLFDLSETNIVTVARLVPQKAIDRLLEVHYQLKQKGLKHHIYVIGEGPERQKIENKIKQYKIEDSFTLLGKKENPYPYMKQADYFCLFSKFEGYGMVLEEAKILQKLILITDTAAREAVEDYPYSCIFENTTQGIEKGLEEILKKKTLAQKLTLKTKPKGEIIEKIITMIGRE